MASTHYSHFTLSEVTFSKGNVIVRTIDYGG
jgi:hypothetical protein